MLASSAVISQKSDHDYITGRLVGGGVMIMELIRSHSVGRRIVDSGCRCGIPL